MLVEYCWHKPTAPLFGMSSCC